MLVDSNIHHLRRQTRAPGAMQLHQDRQTELISLLQSWIEEGDDEEQRETGEYLIHALDEDRLSDRKLFPVELKGITW